MYKLALANKQTKGNKNLIQKMYLKVLYQEQLTGFQNSLIPKTHNKYLYLGC